MAVEGSIVEVVGAGCVIPGLGRRRRELLRDINFSVSAGEAVGIAGPSGAGKTTLLRMVMGLIPACAGRVSLFGLAPRDAFAVHAIGYAPDDGGFPPGLTGAECLEMHERLLVQRSSGVVAKSFGDGAGAARVLAGRLGLSSDLGRPIPDWSPGMRVRLAIAVALLGRPEVVILDDPFSGIDPEQRNVIRELMLEHVACGGALILTSHLLFELEGIVTRVAVVASGTISVDEPAAGVFADADAWYRRAVGNGAGA